MAYGGAPELDTNIFSNSEDRDYTPTVLPTLEVVKTIPKMEAGINIDWLLHTYYARREFERCKSLISRELPRQLNPEYLYFVKGLIDREEGNNMDALRNLQKAIDLNPQNIETYKEIGKTLYAMGRYDQALNAFRQAETELTPRTDHEIYHYIGELLLRSAAAMASVEGLDPAVAMKPTMAAKTATNPAAATSTTKTEATTDMTTETLTELLSKMKMDSETVASSETQKEMMTEMLSEMTLKAEKETHEQTETANETYTDNETGAQKKKTKKKRSKNTASDDDENPAETRRRLYQEAKLYFQKAVQCGKKLESFQRLAEIHRMENDYGRAIEVLEHALLLAPDNADLLTEIGVLYLKLNDTQKAFDRLQEVVNSEKSSARALLAFGAILQSRNDVDAALGKYRELAATEPEMVELWNNIGLCFFRKQKYIAAISSLRKAIWISPTNYNALYNLSLVYIRAEQYASAFHTLAAAINLRKDDNAECYMLLGLCLRKLDDPENAFNAFQRSSTIAESVAAAGGAGRSAASRNPLVHLNFALFCYETGRLAMANEQYNRFVSVSQDMQLPTEYKFQATKLKSLLKISTTHILSNDSVNGGEQKDETTELSGNLAGMTLKTTTGTTTTEADNGPNASWDNLVGVMTDDRLLGRNAASEMPLEVNAVVSSVGMPTVADGASTSQAAAAAMTAAATTSGATTRLRSVRHSATK